jgi:AcrR family transcriptional regulator
MEKNQTDQTADLRHRLLAAAHAVLEEDGHGGLALREVARRAGVSAMAPYRHFDNREALLAELAAQGFDRLADALTAAGVDAEGRSLAQAMAYIGFARKNPGLFRLMFGPMDATQKARLQPAAAHAHAQLAAGVQRDLARARWAIVHGLACLIIDQRLAIDDGDSIDDVVRRTVGVAGLGIDPGDDQSPVA